MLAFPSCGQAGVLSARFPSRSVANAMSAADMAQGQTLVTTSTPAAAELDRRLAGLSPGVDPAVDDRTRVVAPSGEDARCDRGARPGLADRDERSVGRELDSAEREQAVGDVAAARDVTRVALVLLPDVDQLGARSRGSRRAPRPSRARAPPSRRRGRSRRCRGCRPSAGPESPARTRLRRQLQRPVAAASRARMRPSSRTACPRPGR